MANEPIITITGNLTGDPELKPSTAEWREIPGWEGLYEVSDSGEIRRSPRSRGKGAVPGKVLKKNSNGPGRLHKWVMLYRNSVGTKMYIHRAVALAFVEGQGDVVRHLDDDPSNNTPVNLAWGTQRDNVRDMFMNGHASNGRRALTQCPQGHRYDKENTYITKRGHRSCRTCSREKAKLKRSRKAA